MPIVKRELAPRMQFVSNRDRGLRELLRRMIRESEVMRFAVAYVKVSGVRTIERELKQSIAAGGKLRLVTCEDFNLTEGEALQRLHDLGADMRLYSNPYQGGFHPKVYIGEARSTFSCIVGSANLSEQAFKSNVEAGVYFEGPGVEPAVAGTANFFYDLWSDTNSMVIDTALIKQFKKVERYVHERTPRPDRLAARAAEDAPEYGRVRQEALSKGRKVVEMCRQAMAVGERLHDSEVTDRVLKLFPEWKHGRTPDASIRRDMMLFSYPKHKPVDEAIFGWDEKEAGFYTRLR